MEELVVGIDLCDSYTQINCAEEEKTWSFPTVICRHKTEDAWFVGEEAYAHTLKGDGIIVDKLVKLVCKDGTATLGNVRYEARELLALFLERIMRLPEEEYGKKQIGLAFLLTALAGCLLHGLFMNVVRSWEFQESGFTLSAILKAIFTIFSAREKKSGMEP